MRYVQWREEWEATKVFSQGQVKSLTMCCRSRWMNLFEFQDSLGYQRNAVLNKTKQKTQTTKLIKYVKWKQLSVIVQASLQTTQVSSQNLGTFADINAGKIKMHIKIQKPLKQWFYTSAFVLYVGISWHNKWTLTLQLYTLWGIIRLELYFPLYTL